MKHAIYLLLMLIVLFASCNNSDQSEDVKTKILDYKYFTIRVLRGWNRVDVKGMDSFVGRIAIDSATYVGFDLGWYCDRLDEGRPTAYYSVESGNVYIPDSCAKQDLKHPNKWRCFGKADSSTLEVLKRNTASWATIDHYKAKIVSPKKPGLGTTGIYIDSLWKAGDGVDGFVLSAHNLNPTQQKQLLVAIKSLKFYRRVK